MNKPGVAESSEFSELHNRQLPPARILIVRLGAMGDVLHGLPAVAALRAVFPGSVIGWLIEERWAELLCTLPTPRAGPRSAQCPLLDRIHTVNMKQWRASPFSLQTWERIAAGLSDLRAQHYDVAIDLQGSIRSSLLAHWSGAPLTYGFAQPRESLASMFYNRQVIARGDHVVEQNLSLAQAVAQRPLLAPKVELPHDPGAEQECDRWLKERGIEKFVVLNPGAGWGAKQWPPDRYGQVAITLIENGLKMLVNFGPGENKIAHAVKAASNGAVETFTGSLTQLIALMRRARLFIGGDTGPMHLAAALGVPVVGIFGPTNPARNGPFGTRNIVLRSSSSVTSYSHVADPDAGLLDISPEQVVSASKRLLKESYG